MAVSMFPVPTVEFSDVALGEPAAGETALAAQQLTVNLRVMPLLARRIEIANISVVRPRIAVTVDADGHTNWSPLIDILARALKPNAQRDERVLSFSEIGIKDGVVALRVPHRNVDETLEAGERRPFPAGGRLRPVCPQGPRRGQRQGDLAVGPQCRT